MRHLHPLPHRARGEAAEDHVVRSTDPGTGEHGHDDLGNHREEDPDHVPPADTEILQAVGQALYVAVQVRVGDSAFLALLAPPVVGDALPEPGLDVPIQTVVGDVERAVGEPGHERRRGLVEHLGEGRVPVQFAGPPGPVGLGIPRRSGVHLGIGDARPSAELRWRIETFDLCQPVEELLELLSGLGDLGVVASGARRYLGVRVSRVGHVAEPFGVGGGRPGQASTRSSRASPCPPPPHSAAAPSPPPRRRSSRARCSARRAPDAPTG